MTTGRINQVAFLHDVAARMPTPLRRHLPLPREGARRGNIEVRQCESERHSFVLRLSNTQANTRPRKSPSASCRQMHRIRESEQPTTRAATSLAKAKAERDAGFRVRRTPSEGCRQKGLTRLDASIARGNRCKSRPTATARINSGQHQ